MRREKIQTEFAERVADTSSVESPLQMNASMEEPLPKPVEKRSAAEGLTLASLDRKFGIYM